MLSLMQKTSLSGLRREQYGDSLLVDIRVGRNQKHVLVAKVLHITNLQTLKPTKKSLKKGYKQANIFQWFVRLNHTEKHHSLFMFGLSEG